MVFLKNTQPKFSIFRKLGENTIGSGKIPVLDRPPWLGTLDGETNHAPDFGQAVLQETPFTLNQKQQEFTDRFRASMKNGVNKKPDPKIKTPVIIEKSKSFFGSLSKIIPARIVENVKQIVQKNPEDTQSQAEQENNLNLQSLPVGTVIEMSVDKNQTEIIDGVEIRSQFPNKKILMIVNLLKDGKTKGVNPYAQGQTRVPENQAITISEIKIGNPAIIGDPKNPRSSRNLGTVVDFSVTEPNQVIKREEKISPQKEFAASEAVLGVKQYINDVILKNEGNGALARTDLQNSLQKNSQTIKAYAAYFKNIQNRSLDAKITFEFLSQIGKANESNNYTNLKSWIGSQLISKDIAPELYKTMSDIEITLAKPV